MHYTNILAWVQVQIGYSFCTNELCTGLKASAMSVINLAVNNRKMEHKAYGKTSALISLSIQQFRSMTQFPLFAYKTIITVHCILASLFPVFS